MIAMPAGERPHLHTWKLQTARPEDEEQPEAQQRVARNGRELDTLRARLGLSAGPSFPGG